jgi:glutathione reductase (NADPH)
VLTLAGVEILRRRATVWSPHEVEINGKKITAKHILVATGSWPVLPQIPGREHAITSNEAFYLERLPERALVVGGGYIALEFASIFHGLGVKTTLSYRGKRLLRGFDVELGERIAEEMKAKGMTMHFGGEPIAIARRTGRGLEVAYSDGPHQETDLILFATGRRPNTANLGLEAAGVKLAADGAVAVDKFSRSSVPSIHAIGDVTNRVNLTPVATAEGMWLARTLFRDEPHPVDHEHVPTAVFSNPNLATVGLSEEKARERYGAVDIYKTSFRALKLTLTDKHERTFMKLVVDRASQRVLGAHMIGPDAGEIIQGIAIAVKLGATKTQFDETIGIHPTAAEEFVTMREKAV